MSNESECAKYIGAVQHVPVSALAKDRDPQVVQANEIPDQILSKVNKYRDMTVKHIIAWKVDDAYSNFILERYLNGFWIRWRLRENAELTAFEFLESIPDRNSNVRESKLRDWVKLDIPDFLNIWRRDKELLPSSATELWALDMTPPGYIPVKEERSTTTSKLHYNPKTYFQRKYFEALFSMRIPLAYFVKSNLSRLRNLCKNSPTDGTVTYQMVVSEMLLSFEDFDKRHGTSAGGLVQFEFESRATSELRRHILTQSFHLSSLENETFKKVLALILKSREIKLQVLILLELISMNKMDGKLRNFEDKYKSKLKKRARNVAKIGVISRRRKAKGKNEGSQHLDFCERLDIYVDKLCIIDVILRMETSDMNMGKEEDSLTRTAIEKLMEYKKNMLNNGKEPSSFGFVSYVLIPYYTRRVPNAVEFISRKIKGPKLESSLPVFKRAASSASMVINDAVLNQGNIECDISQTRKNSIVSTESPINSPSPSTSLPKLQRVTSNIIQPPLIKTRTDSHLSEFLELESNSLRKPAVASRANSEIPLTKLQKRQLSVSDLISEEAKKYDIPKDHTFNIAGKSLNVNRSLVSASFQRIGKRKLSHAGASSKLLIERTEASVQVEATPHGKQGEKTRLQLIREPAIIESPLKITEVAASPCRNPKQLPDAELTYETPIKDGVISSTIKDLQIPASDQKNAHTDTGIIYSPQHMPPKKVRRRLFGPQG
ncbi:LAFE_0C06458g1_1 [Lachancea fermentati]|uniref:LAFE_0C06458g1_1 n=1 Tax=Lachancea fermentati TaxID=4955 RepID=A0A1G4M9P1_LACFM|nr:LAFE_0C06458g1_1 [Lachancea fermentati]